MPDFQTIYAQHAEQYEELVAHEDYQGNILRALAQIRPLAQADVVEMGAGTGRLTLLLAPLARSIRAYDASRAMLDVAAAKLQRAGLQNWQIDVADNRALPAASASADLAIAGWSFGHMTGWYPDSWRAEIAQMLGEMLRVLRPGGTAVILETLGSGRDTPQPPSDALAAYYALLEQEQGFSSSWIRTDYRFASQAEAERITDFFFGAPMPTIPQPDGQAIVVECTGIWWRTR